MTLYYPVQDKTSTRPVNTQNYCGEWANRPGDESARNRAETSTNRNWRGLEIGGNMHGQSERRQPLSCLSRCRRWTVRTCCREQSIVFDVGTNAT